MSTRDFLYFGCIGQPGHYMHRPPGVRDWKAETPWGPTPDGNLCPKGPEIQGAAILHHKDGWTALSWWDRSVDRRGGCNSNVFAIGTHTFEEMVAIAGVHFPEVIQRQPVALFPWADA